MLKGAAAGLLGLSAVPVLSSCGTEPPAVRAAATGPPRRGGVLRVGTAGGGSSDSLDAHNPVTHPDICRGLNLYEPLLYRDRDYTVQAAVAESVQPSKDGMSWTVRIRDGITFHDGRPVRPEDVIFSYRRVTDPKKPQAAANLLSSVDRDGYEKLDDRTLRITMRTPDASIHDVFADYRVGIVPEGYDPKKPVGTGPFKFVSFTPGQQSVFARFGDYWRDGQPYVDELRIINFTDDTARVNALLAGQVDAIESLPYAEVRVIQADPTLEVLISKTGNWDPFTMRVDTGPYKDVRVRQAMRLAVDREQMVNQVLSGHGRLANDMYSPVDPDYLRDVPQRHYDPEQARSLLKKAGHDKLQVELTTSEVSQGIVEAAQVLQQQATKAGVDIKLRKVDTNTFYGDQYLKWPFAQDFWGTWPYLVQSALGSQPKSPFNECHWADPTYLDLVDSAKRTLDSGKRRTLLQDAQHIEYDRGGYVVWGFLDCVDAVSRRVTGLKSTNTTGFPLDAYRFREVWFV